MFTGIAQRQSIHQRISKSNSLYTMNVAFFKMNATISFANINSLSTKSIHKRFQESLKNYPNKSWLRSKKVPQAIQAIVSTISLLMDKKTTIL